MAAAWRVKKTAIILEKCLLLLVCGVLLSYASATLMRQIRIILFNPQQTPLTTLNVTHTESHEADLHGSFSTDSVDNYTVQRDGKDAFKLFLAHYQDVQKQQRRAILFSDSHQSTDKPSDPMSLRQSIWQEAAIAIKQYTPENALILSWWDDGQRIHFLSGRDTWLNKPGSETFAGSFWPNLQNSLLLATDKDREPLTKMARWLTMYSNTALVEMRHFFGASRPVYLVVTHDLLMRTSEMADYGGLGLSFSSKNIPVHDNLHGDISQIKQWSLEEGDGNYLVQKEGLSYRVWATPKYLQTTKNSLLVRLLPFVDSLKQLPKGVQLVYQSHWGGYLSIYKIDMNS